MIGLNLIKVAYGAGICAVTAAVAQAGLGAPKDLRCEYGANPLGIDTPAPRLTWQVNDDRYGAVQAAYQVAVSTDPKMADEARVVWDTGKVESDSCVLVPYAGKPLTSATRYYWRVRTWDGQGQASPHSEPAWFEMGLLKAEDWIAKWIAPPADEPQEPELPWGDWIWNDEVKGDKATAFFRAVVDLPIGVRIHKATLRITADNSFTAFMNGRRIAVGADYRQIVKLDTSHQLEPGLNILAVEVKNDTGPAGLIYTLRVELNDGKVVDTVSGPEAKTFAKAVDHWNQPSFDDDAWRKASVVGPYGCEPWKQLKEPPGPQRSQYVRKEFKVGAGVARARVYATGLGTYVLHINGQRVGDDIFAPGWTKYDKRIQYRTFDVTKLLNEGDNAIGAILGNAWWSSGLGWLSVRETADQGLLLTAQLRIDYEDGRSETVATDTTWKLHPSPITRNTLYHGETHDARLEISGWDRPGLDEKDWKPAIEAKSPTQQLCAQVGEPIRVTQELKVEQISEPAKGTYIFDFGQNASGYVRIKVKGPAGTKIRLRFGEVLDNDGTLYRANYRSAEATDYYVCRGEGEEVWEPTFTYRGFQLCEVTGWPGVPDRDSLTFRVLHSAAAPAGEFECSNWLINRVQRAITWGQRSNMHSVPTDCPQRDERLGWMGDAQIFAPTACWNMNMAPFFAKWMRDIVDSQAPDGATTDVAPTVVVHGPAAPGWGDAVTVVPWTVYRFYGDTRIIEENYDAMVRWVEYMRGKAKDGLLYDRKGYGDWVPVVTSPSEPIGAAYYYHSTKLVSKMAAVIGKKADADKYAELANRIAERFNSEYLDKSANYLEGTQAANLLPLHFGITPPDQRKAVFENIVKDVKTRGDHLSTGFLASAMLLPTLTRFGQQDLAYRVATQSDYPSLGYMVTHGATTIWERWNSDKMDPSMNSRNHFAFGSAGEWYFETLAGIQPDPDAPGFKHFIIHPQPTGDLTWVKATYPSAYGMIESHWELCEGTLVLNVSIPANTSARVHVPVAGSEPPMIAAGTDEEAVKLVKQVGTEAGCNVYEVPAGRYQFIAAGQ